MTLAPTKLSSEAFRRIHAKVQPLALDYLNHLEGETGGDQVSSLVRLLVIVWEDGYEAASLPSASVDQTSAGRVATAGANRDQGVNPAPHSTPARVAEEAGICPRSSEVERPICTGEVVGSKPTGGSGRDATSAGLPTRDEGPSESKSGVTAGETAQFPRTSEAVIGVGDIVQVVGVGPKWSGAIATVTEVFHSAAIVESDEFGREAFGMSCLRRIEDPRMNEAPKGVGSDHARVGRAQAIGGHDGASFDRPASDDSPEAVAAPRRAGSLRGGANEPADARASYAVKPGRGEGVPGGSAPVVRCTTEAALQCTYLKDGQRCSLPESHPRAGYYDGHEMGPGDYTVGRAIEIVDSAREGEREVAIRRVAMLIDGGFVPRPCTDYATNKAPERDVTKMKRCHLAVGDTVEHAASGTFGTVVGVAQIEGLVWIDVQWLGGSDRPHRVDPDVLQRMPRPETPMPRGQWRVGPVLPFVKWRVGRTLGRTIYRNDQCVGIVDTPELAECIVDSANRPASASYVEGWNAAIDKVLAWLKDSSTPPDYFIETISEWAMPTGNTEHG